MHTRQQQRYVRPQQGRTRRTACRTRSHTAPRSHDPSAGSRPRAPTAAGRCRTRPTNMARRSSPCERCETRNQSREHTSAHPGRRAGCGVAPVPGGSRPPPPRPRGTTAGARGSGPPASTRSGPPRGMRVGARAAPASDRHLAARRRPQAATPVTWPQARRRGLTEEGKRSTSLTCGIVRCGLTPIIRIRVAPPTRRAGLPIVRRRECNTRARRLPAPTEVVPPLAVIAAGLALTARR